MNARLPSVSVVMPVRDARDTLEAALASIHGQTLGDWELIAVNDGSTDGCGDILSRHAAADPRIRVIETPPQGIVGALQLGCREARGEWIARMDADDRMVPQRLEEQLGHAQDHPDLGVISSLVAYGGEAPGYAAHVDWLNGQRSPEEISLRRFVEAPVAHPSVMFRRDLIPAHGGYRDGDFPEDYELWLRWLDAGVGFGKVDRELLVWNDPPQRLSRNDPRYDVDRFYDTKCHWLARWLERHVELHRGLWLWGAGRITRRRFDPLESLGHRFDGFIDIDPKKANRHRDGRVVRLADDLPDPSGAFLLVGVGKRGAREKIHGHLIRRGWAEGRDFLLVA